MEEDGIEEIPGIGSGQCVLKGSRWRRDPMRMDPSGTPSWSGNSSVLLFTLRGSRWIVVCDGSHCGRQLACWPGMVAATCEKGTEVTGWVRVRREREVAGLP